MKPIGIEHFFDAFSLEKKRPLKVDAASALNIPVNEVSDLLVVSQDKAKRFELTPVWAPAEPPTKRAKTAEVRLSSASNVPMPPTNDDNEKGSSEEEDSDSSGSNSDPGSYSSSIEQKKKACVPLMPDYQVEVLPAWLETIMPLEHFIARCCIPSYPSHGLPPTVPWRLFFFFFTA